MTVNQNNPAWSISKHASRFILLCPVLVLAILAFTASSASAAEPWWHITSGAAPANLPPEGEGQIVLTATNLGEVDANGATMPIKIIDTLPAGLKAAASEAAHCSKTPPISCTYTSAGVVEPYATIEVRIKVEVLEGASSGEVNRASVSGGGAPRDVSVTRPVTISEAPVPFGVENYELTPEEEGGALDTQAGSHPFQLTTTLDLNQTSEPAKPPALAKDLHFILPPGLVGNPTVFPQCSGEKFLEEIQGEPVDKCPDDTAIGVAIVKVLYEDNAFAAKQLLTETVPLFNLTPTVGEPARFGFYVDKVPVYLDTSVRTGGDYGVTVSVDNIPQAATFISSQVTLWGVPGDARHDNTRGLELHR